MISRRAARGLRDVLDPNTPLFRGRRGGGGEGEGGFRRGGVCGGVKREREREEREEKGVLLGFLFFFETVLYFYLSTIKIRARQQKRERERDVRAGGGGPRTPSRRGREEGRPPRFAYFFSRRVDPGKRLRERVASLVRRGQAE